MDKLNGIKPGDRVRVTFEGEVEFCGVDYVNVTVDAGDPLSSSFTAADTKSPHFHIERIEKPLAVGDRVRRKDSPFQDSHEIVAVKDGWAVVSLVEKTMDGKPFGIIPIRDLERLP